MQRNLFRMIAIASGAIALTATPVLAQADRAAPVQIAQLAEAPNPQNIRKQLEELQAFISEADESLTSNRAALDEELDYARQAPAIIDETISRLEGIVARFESGGDIRQEMAEYQAFAEERQKEYAGSVNSALNRIAPRFGEMAAAFGDLQVEAEQKVDMAMTEIRRLRENREGAVALIQLGALEEAKAILRDSLNKFDQVIDETREYSTSVEQATAGFGAF